MIHTALGTFTFTGDLTILGLKVLRRGLAAGRDVPLVYTVGEKTFLFGGVI